MRTPGSQQLGKRHDFFWLSKLAPADPQVPALPRTSQHLRGKRNEISTQDLKPRPQTLVEVRLMNTGWRSSSSPQRLEVVKTGWNWRGTKSRQLEALYLQQGLDGAESSAVATLVRRINSCVRSPDPQQILWRRIFSIGLEGTQPQGKSRLCGGFSVHLSPQGPDTI